MTISSKILFVLAADALKPMLLQRLGERLLGQRFLLRLGAPREVGIAHLLVVRTSGEIKDTTGGQEWRDGVLVFAI